MGGRGPRSLGVSGSTSLGMVPSLRTEIHPRLAVNDMLDRLRQPHVGAALPDSAHFGYNV